MRPSLRHVGLFASAVSVVLVAACVDNASPPPDHPAYTTDGAAPLSCVPNLDGKIDANELAPAVGVPVSYLVSPPSVSRPVNVAGSTDAAGHLAWDFSIDLADDRFATISASALDGKWYAASFPAGQFVVPFDAADSLEAIYTHDDQAMSLLGLASTVENPPEGKTLLVYASPVALFRFPIAPGAAWTSVGDLSNGTLRGLPYAGRDTYDVKADAVGTLTLPDFTFTQVHRVRTQLTNQPAVGATIVQRQVSFLFECFGEVARATSATNEANADFTTAAEVRRLGVKRQ